ncbi:MAG: hypothetical protein EB084_09835 [Proteobacteria bacterium]|nr:hypothetical protein [Pseudomonadota bacterium]
MLMSIPVSRLSTTRPMRVSRASRPAPRPAPQPRDALTLRDYTPRPLDYARLALWPTASGGLGALAGQSHVLTVGLCGLAGGTLGLVVGAGIGTILDRRKHKDAVEWCGLGGCLAGAIAAGIGGAALAPVTATAMLGMGGAALGALIALSVASDVQKSRRREVDGRAYSGEVRLAPLLGEIAAREKVEDPLVHRMLRAMDRLEGAGWRFGTSLQGLEATVRYSTTSKMHLYLALPDQGNTHIEISSLPTLALIADVGDAADVDDAALVTCVKGYATAGRALQSPNETRVDLPAAAEAIAILLSGACTSIEEGEGAVYVHDGARFPVTARDAASLVGAMRTLEQTLSQYDAHLAPLFASGALDPEQKNPVLKSIEASACASDLARGATLLVRLATARPELSDFKRTAVAASVLRAMRDSASPRRTLEQNVDDAAVLLRRMERDDVLRTLFVLRKGMEPLAVEQVERFHDVFLRLLTMTGDNADRSARASNVLCQIDKDDIDSTLASMHRYLAPISDASPLSESGEASQMRGALARAAAAQPSYTDLTLDCATLDAFRDPDETLSASIADYEGLLSSLASIDRAAEAAPTYALIRNGMRHGAFGSRTFEEVSADFFGACVTGATPEEARMHLRRSSHTSSGTVKADHDTVTIGGVKVPVHH